MEKLFSYGTLQQKNVQFEIYGRNLEGKIARLRKYRLSEIEIKNADVVQKSGKKVHPVAKYTGNRNDTIQGVILEINKKELLQSDKYEVEEYERIAEEFEDGSIAWVYVCRKTNSLRNT